MALYLNRLREEVECKNTQLASKDIEMESYKKVTDEKIFQPDAQVKGLERKISESSSQCVMRSDL
jgi:hypothetical protein